MACYKDILSFNLDEMAGNEAGYSIQVTFTALPVCRARVTQDAVFRGGMQAFLQHLC